MKTQPVRTRLPYDTQNTAFRLRPRWGLQLIPVFLRWELMDSAQEQHQRQVGDQLIEWYNKRHSTSLQFDGRPGDAPDSYYSDGNARLRVEVTNAFYDDGDDATFK